MYIQLQIIINHQFVVLYTCTQTLFHTQHSREMQEIFKRAHNCHGPAGVPRLATRCLCVLSTWLVVCLVPCAPMSIVCPLPSCYLIIVSVAPAVSPLLPSFVSLYSLLVSAVLC